MAADVSLARSTSGPGCGLSSRAGPLLHRKGKRHRRAAARSVLGDGHPTVRPGHGLHDGQAEAGPAVAVGLAPPGERLERPAQHLGREAPGPRPRPRAGARPPPDGLDPNDAAGRAVPDRVVEQVVQDLPQARGVDGDGLLHRLHLKANPGRRGRRGVTRGRLLDQRPDRHELAMNSHGARPRPDRIEEVLGQPDQPVGLGIGPDQRGARPERKEGWEKGGEDARRRHGDVHPPGIGEQPLVAGGRRPGPTTRPTANSVLASRETTRLTLSSPVQAITTSQVCRPASSSKRDLAGIGQHLAP